MQVSDCILGIAYAMKKIVIASIAGLGVGLLILAAGLNWEGVSEFQAALRIIHAPANWFAHLWSYDLNLPPNGEAAFAIVPMAAAVLQWTLLGFLIGLGLCVRSRSRQRRIDSTRQPRHD